MKNGDKINAKVLEVGTTEIKYKKSQNPEGPTYVNYKNDVALIEYKNGYKEVYTNQNNNYGGNHSDYGFSDRRRNNNHSIIILPRLGWGWAWMWHPHKWWKHWCW
jgi:hypothetical protein